MSNFKDNFSKKALGIPFNRVLDSKLQSDKPIVYYPLPIISTLSSIVLFVCFGYSALFCACYCLLGFAIRKLVVLEEDKNDYSPMPIVGLFTGFAMIGSGFHLETFLFTSFVGFCFFNLIVIRDDERRV